MGVLSKLNMLRRSFETALDLIDAIALEYYFINNTIDVKTKLAEGQFLYVWHLHTKCT